MSHHYIPKIRELLAGRPLGASADELARVMDVKLETIGEALLRMVERREVTQTGSVWRLNRSDVTPPIFRAMETLEAMQVAARGAR